MLMTKAGLEVIILKMLKLNLKFLFILPKDCLTLPRDFISILSKKF